MNSSNQKKWSIAAIFATSGVAILLFAPDRMFAIDSGMLGSAILLLSSWGALLLWRNGRTATPDATASEAKIQSSSRACFSLAVHIGIAIYFVVAMQRLGWSAGIDQAQTGVVARNIVLALIAWSVLENRLVPRSAISTGDASVFARRGNEIAYAVLAIGVAGVAVSLALVPAANAAAMPSALIANFLVAILITSSLAGALVRALPVGRARL